MTHPLSTYSNTLSPTRRPPKINTYKGKYIKEEAREGSIDKNTKRECWIQIHQEHFLFPFCTILGKPLPRWFPCSIHDYGSSHCTIRCIPQLCIAHRSTNHYRMLGPPSIKSRQVGHALCHQWSEAIPYTSPHRSDRLPRSRPCHHSWLQRRRHLKPESVPKPSKTKKRQYM